jgi:hypothetical protein
MYPSFNEADGGEQIHITPGVEVTAGNFVATTIYKILDLGTASDSDWQGVGFSGTPKVGDTFTANGNGSAVTGGVVTELYTAINQDDSWKHIIEILDND